MTRPGPWYAGGSGSGVAASAFWVTAKRVDRRRGVGGSVCWVAWRRVDRRRGGGDAGSVFDSFLLGVPCRVVVDPGLFCRAGGASCVLSSSVSPSLLVVGMSGCTVAESLGVWLSVVVHGLVSASGSSGLGVPGDVGRCRCFRGGVSLVGGTNTHFPSDPSGLMLG